MRIGVLTGGGDVPGLNGVIRDITFRAKKERSDNEVIGIKRGWGGLIWMNPDNPEIDSKHTEILTMDKVRRIDREGGTILHTSRTFPLEVTASDELEKFRGIKLAPKEKRDMSREVIKNLQNLKLDYLIPIGGDDTLKFARYLHHAGFPIIAVPKTMDGDVAGTDYTLGFSTAITRGSDKVTRDRTVLGSNERIGVFEIFGRYAGFTALYTSLIAKSDRTIIAEVDFDIEKLAKLLVDDRSRSPSNYSLVIVSEGAKMIGEKIVTEGNDEDPYGHKKLGGIGKIVAKRITELTRKKTTDILLTYDLRSGEPMATDKYFATRFANLAMDAVLDGKSGLLAARRNGAFVLVPLEDTAPSPKTVDPREYNAERYRPNHTRIEGLVPLI